jgi:hypothetical protein
MVPSARRICDNERVVVENQNNGTAEHEPQHQGIRQTFVPVRCSYRSTRKAA